MGIQEKRNVLKNRRLMAQDTVIELCFGLLREDKSVIELSRTATILGGCIKPGLGNRVQDFLKENPDLPKRVKEILGSSVTRMQGF